MTELKRSVGLFHITMYSVGLILGAGVYVLIGQAAGLAGNAVWLAFVLGTIVAGFAGLSYAELSAMFPRAVAEYVFVKNAFKSNFVAFIVGWLTAITSVITAATVALGFAGYFVQFVDASVIAVAVVMLIALSIVNFLGIRESAWLNTAFAIVTAAGLVLIVALGATYEAGSPVDYLDAPLGITGVVLAFILIFFAFIGFEDVANVAEEVKRPQKTMPRGIILSIIVTGVIYVLVSLIVVRVVEWEQLAQSSAPLALVAERILGPGGSVMLSVIALFATASTVLITLVAGARMVYGMARHSSIPSICARIHPRTKTPWIAVILVMVTSVSFAFIGDIVIVANITVFAIVITFVMVNLSVILLRYTEPERKRPFRIPVNIGRFPVLPLIGLGMTVYMSVQFGADIIVVGAGIIASGIAFYFVYKKRRGIQNS